MTSHLETVAEAVRKTGELLVDLKHRNRTSGQWEGTQFKAEADGIAHDSLSHGLARIDPAIPIVSEEDEASSLASPATYWLIDPIDGTASFAHGYSGYVCQAALIVDEMPSLGVVFAPEYDLLFAAASGEGATANGNRLRPREAKTGWTLIDNYPEPRGLASDAFAELPCERYVESGSIGLKICRVAEGVADLFVKDVGVRDWDVAAPQLVLTEAGGALTDLRGVPMIYGTDGRRHVGLIASGNHAIHARAVNWSRSRTG